MSEAIKGEIRKLEDRQLERRAVHHALIHIRIITQHAIARVRGRKLNRLLGVKKRHWTRRAVSLGLFGCCAPCSTFPSISQSLG
jgi:hypothetical protein